MIVQHSDPAEISHFRNFTVLSTKIHKKSWFLFLRSVHYRTELFSWISWWKFCSTYILSNRLFSGFTSWFHTILYTGRWPNKKPIDRHSSRYSLYCTHRLRQVCGRWYILSCHVSWSFILAADYIELSCVYSMHFERVALHKSINWYFSKRSIKMAMLSLMLKRMVYPVDVASSFLVHHFSWLVFSSVLYTGSYNSDNNKCTRSFVYFNNSII